MPAHADRRRELLATWERRSRFRGGTEHTTGADALFLVTALSTALRRASETPELGRAARTWGARFAAPVEALSSLAVLRDALIELADASDSGLPVPLAVLNRIFDQASLEAVDAASANLRSEARNDPLTGCANRRALEEDLVHAVSSARRSNLDIAVAVVDLDGLKQINDSRGHGAGDAALLALVRTLQGALREADSLYRTGGDEFVVVAPFTDAAGARALMRRAERATGPAFSWGVASLIGVGATPAGDPAALMEAADSDLYLRRRSTRDAAAKVARKRRAAAAVSVAASVAVTASIAGLAVALDSGVSVPAAHSVGAGNASRTGRPDSALRTFGPASPGDRSSKGGTGTDLAGLLGADVAVPPTATSAPGPAASVPVVPGAGSTGTVGTPNVTLVSATTPAQPVALVSGPAPIPAQRPAPTAPNPLSGPTVVALAAPAPPAGPGTGHGNGNGRPSWSGHANAAGPSSPGSGRGRPKG